MKKENIPNALTLIRVVMIPIFIAILSLSHSYLGHIVAAVILLVVLRRSEKAGRLTIA